MDKGERAWRMRWRKAAHAKFGYKPGRNGKCACAYCRRDIDAVFDHSAELEMENEHLRDRLESFTGKKAGV